MSDFVTTTLNTEPDESVLTNALRNQDDIPILMDVVAGQEGAAVSLGGDDAQAIVSLESDLDSIDSFSAHKPLAAKETSVSQEAHFSRSMDDGVQRDLSSSEEDADREKLETAIRSVLEKKLPELITDVLVEYAKLKK